MIKNYFTHCMYVINPLSSRAKKLTYFGAVNDKKIFDLLHVCKQPTFLPSEKLIYFEAVNDKKLFDPLYVCNKPTFLPGEKVNLVWGGK